MILTPSDAVTAGPLRVKTPLFDGVTFLCVRSSAKKFAPFRQNISRLAISAKGAALFEDAVLEAGQGDADRGKAIMALPPERLLEIDKLTEAMALLDADEPAEKVADLVLGWEGPEDEFSRDAMLSLLTDAPVGEANCAVMNGEGPLVLSAGDYANFTVGQALCRIIPEEIRLGTARELSEIEEKKALPESTPSSGVGSGTATPKRKSRSKRPGSKS